MKYLIPLLVMVALFWSMSHVEAPLGTDWWNSSWTYRFQLDVNTTNYTRVQWPIEVDVNFTATLSTLGAGGTFDINSTRIVEHNSSGQAINEVISQFDPHPHYNESTNAAGTIIFILNGTTSSQTIRTFYLYFDTLENGAKFDPAYTSNLTVNWDGEEFNVNNTLVQWYVDTIRGQNTSGIYRVVHFNTIFNTGSTDPTAEYVLYSNGTNNFTFDFRNNASVVSGPTRVTVTQVGDEVYWNDFDNTTGQGRMTKTYTFYGEEGWLRIHQNFTNIGNTTITRNATPAGALRWNLTLFGGNSSDATRDTNETDPGSYTWAGERFGLFHLGVINENESNTTNFFASAEPLSGNIDYGRIGIQLNTTTIAPNESITQSAIVDFNGTQADVNQVRSLRDQLLNQVIVTQQSPESLVIVINSSTNATIYNRGEHVLITGNTTTDPFVLAGFMNATVDMGTTSTADDVTIQLFDDGAHGDGASADGLFANTFNLTENDTLGSWNISVRAYDNELTFLNESNTTIDVTNAYNGNVSIHIPVILTGSFVNATFLLNNYRNDTAVPNANISCHFDGTPVSNVTDLGTGSYLMNFTSPSVPGSYVLNCTGIQFNNTGIGLRGFDAEDSITSLVLNATPPNTSISSISQNASETFLAILNISNVENATARSVNITLDLPGAWSANTTSDTCGTILTDSYCLRHYNITIANNTVPALYQINFTVDWENPNTTVLSNQTTINVTVESNPLVASVEANITSQVGYGSERILGNFTVLSTGNDALINVTFNETNLTNFTFEFIPSNISSLAAGSNQSVQVNITIPLGQSPGKYFGYITINTSNAGLSNLTLEIIILNATSLTLNATPTNVSVSAITQTSNDTFLATVNVSNVLNATARSANITLSLPGNWSANETTSTCGALFPGSFCFRHYTITVANATVPALYVVNATVDWENPNGTILSNQTTINVTVESNPVVDIAESSLSGQIGDGAEQILGNFTVLSTGNDALINVTFNETNLTNFTFEFIPSNISSLAAGSNQSVQVNVTVPLNYLAGNYTGTIVVNTSNDGVTNISITVEVPENVSWTMTPTSCLRTEVPDEGEVCNVSVLNTGNTEIQFNITPSQGNFTFLSTTNFTVSVNSSGNFTVTYNVTNVTKSFYNSTFIVEANHSQATPANISLQIQLVPFIVPLISIQPVPSFLPQETFLDIVVNATDRSSTGISAIIVNVTQPNSTTYSFVLNDTNSSGNITTGQLHFPFANASNVTGSTLERGQYDIVVFVSDNTDANATETSNFTVFTNVSATLMTLDATYPQGGTGSIFYRALDRNASALESAPVTLTIRDPTGNITYNESFVTDENGHISPLPQFTITNDAELGMYNLTALIDYNDTIANISTNDTTLATFNVTQTDTGGLSADVETAVIWYPENIMKFSMLVKNTAGVPVDPDEMELTVLDPTNDLYTTANLSDFIRIDTGLYNYSYAMPVTTSTGAYLAILNLTKDGLSTLDVHPFIVTTGGPFDIGITLFEQSVPLGDYLDFSITMQNKGPTDIDSLIEYWITQDDTTWYFNGETVLTPGNSNTTIERTAFIFESQSLGLARINAKLTYSNVIPPVTANTTFEIIAADEIPTPPDPPDSDGGTGGTTTTPAGKDIELKIIDYPDEILIVRGWSDIHSVQVLNNGTASLTNVTLLLTGIPTPWATLTPERVETLTPSNSSVFIVEFDIPANAITQNYDIVLTALSSGVTRDSKQVTLMVFQSQRELLEAQLDTVKEKLERLEADTIFADQLGKDVEKIYELIDEIKENIAEAERLLDDESYEKTQEHIITASNLIDTARKLLIDAELKVKLQAQIVPLWQIMLIIVAVLCVNVFLFLWVRGINKQFFGFIKPILRKREKKEKIYTGPDTEKEILKQEREKILRVIKLLEKEKQEGIISEAAYQELKKRNEEKIKNIQKKMK